MISYIKSFFSQSKVVDTALRVVDKVAGTDWTPDQKADFVLKYQEATKHQSPARRLIATIIVIEQFLLVMLWAILSFLNHIMGSSGAGEFATEISSFLQSNVNITLDIIVSFYFIIGIKR